MKLTKKNILSKRKKYTKKNNKIKKNNTKIGGFMVI